MGRHFAHADFENHVEIRAIRANKIDNSASPRSPFLTMPSHPLGRTNARRATE